MNYKKLITVLAAAGIIAGQAFAYEATARLTIEGSLIEESQAKGEGASYEVLKLNALPVTDRNGIEIEFNGGIAGASFDLFYKMAGSAKAEDGWAVSAKGTNLWFKPVDMVKVKVGYVGIDYFMAERVYGTKVGSPFALSSRRDSDGNYTYITNADVDEMGFYVGVNPWDELVVSASVAPGVGKAGITFGSGTKVASWGATAEYFWKDFGFEASYRDNGSKSWKVIRLGCSYLTDRVYAFVQPVIGIDYYAKAGKYAFSGICADLYGEYEVLDGLRIYGHLPVTVRLSGSAKDPSYLEYLFKAEWNLGYVGLLDDVTPYLLVESLEPVTLNSAMGSSLSVNVQCGSDFAVAGCEIGAGLSLKVHSENDSSEKITWAVPFVVKVEM